MSCRAYHRRRVPPAAGVAWHPGRLRHELLRHARHRLVGGRSYSLPAALGLTLAGVPAVLIAFYLVKSLSLTAVRWGVVAVVLYAAAAMLRSAAAERTSSTSGTTHP